VRQLTKHQLNKMTAKELENMLPFEVTSDGETIAAVIPVCDVNKLQPKLETPSRQAHDVNNELPLSKHKQALGRLSTT
jgi:hypothetical protein